MHSKLISSLPLSKSGVSTNMVEECSDYMPLSFSKDKDDTNIDYMENILKKENMNYNRIYLYGIGNYWFAFERSAFYISSFSWVDEVITLIDENNRYIVLVKISKQKIDSMANSHFPITQQSENFLIIDCQVNYKGFEFWKHGRYAYSLQQSRLYYQNVLSNLQSD